ncbi:MAG: cupin domain-containing protein [Gemmatimonadales bacterium]
MDVLSEVLGALRLKGTLYFSTDFRPPWGLRVPAYRRVARFHLVVRGGLWVRVEGQGEPIWLEAGDLILIANGAEHVLADTRDTPCRTVDQVVRDAGFTGRGALTIAGGDDGAPTRLVCGHFEFDEEFRHPFFDGLPPAIVIRWDDYTRGSPLENAFQFVVRRSRRGGLATRPW